MKKYEKKVLAHVRKTSGITHPGVAAQATGYKLATCKRAFDSLVKLNMIEKCVSTDSDGAQYTYYYPVR